MWNAVFCPPQGVKPSLLNLIHSHINFAVLAGWFSPQRVQGRLSISLAGDSVVSLLQLLQRPPPRYHWSQSLKKGSSICTKPHLLFLSVVAVLLLLTMLSTPKPSALVVDESGEVCRLFWATLQLHWVLELPHGLVPAMCWAPQESAQLISAVPPGPAGSEVLHPSQVQLQLFLSRLLSNFWSL